MAINEERSYTEYNVEVPTTDFPIGFDILDDGIDAVAVTINDVDPTTLGYTVIQVNNTTYRFAPAVPSGVVRLTRITDIDQMAHVFTEGAIFISENMDGNFKQIRHSQQEVKDLFAKLRISTDAALVAVESAVVEAGEATEVALAAAEVANNAAGLGLEFKSGVNYYNSDVSTTLGGYPLHAEIMLENGDTVKSTIADNTANPNVDMTGWVKTNDASHIFDASGLSQQEVNNNQSQTNRNLVSIVDIDRSINPNGVANTSEKIQAIVNADESSTVKKKSYLYFPMLNEQYKLESPIRFTRPISNIFGFRAPTYDNDSHNRGGWLLVANSECGFDLGNNRAVAGSTDSWNLQGLAFKPFSAEFQHVADGVRFTTATNGPDRGVTLQQVTARKLNNGFYLKPSANYMIGTLIIEKCNFSTNKIGVNLDVKSEGVRIVGNQIEQCVDGAIRLKGAGGIVISDNMLEGQPNTIEIDATSNGQGSRVEISRNYLEANVGEYLISFKDTSYGKGSLLIRDNQIADLGKYVSGVIEDTDFCRIYNNIYGYGYTIENHESYAVTFMDDATILPDSNLFGRLTTYFKQRDFNNNLGAKVYSRDFMRFAEDATYSALDATGRVLQSPIGDCVSPSAGAEFFSVANYMAGDIVSVNILFKTNFSLTNEGAVSLQVLNTAKTATIITMTSAAISQEINKQYTLGTFVFKVPSNETTLYFKLTNGSEPLLIDMYAGCIKNFGAATLPLKVSPVLPVRTKRYHFSGAVTGFDVAANSQQQQTYTVTGARLGDYVSVAYSANTGGVILSGFVNAANTVFVIYRNNTSSSISLPSGTVKIRTSNC